MATKQGMNPSNTKLQEDAIRRDTEILEMHNSGVTKPEIAEKYDISLPNVARILARARRRLKNAR